MVSWSPKYQPPFAHRHWWLSFLPYWNGEKRLTRNTIKDDIALTPFSPLRLRYRAIWHGSTLHAEVDRIRSIHTGRQPACQKSNELEVSQTPKTFLQRRKKQRELVAPC